MGTHLMECAGNTDPANFGLMSAATWDGVPLAAILDRVRPPAGSWRVRVTGVDDTSVATRSSVPGASWVFSRDDVERTGAFLATRMNGVDLPRDHGHPVRLVVPGWYGCACIKWVSAVDLVADDEPATPQMVEFSRRTHQQRVPALARDYEAPAIDVAAMPVRVEEWNVEGRTEYRVIGIVWGGQKPARALAIRFRHNEPFVPVEHYVPPASIATWSMWSHTWRPSGPGRYRIVLRADDASIRTRRLDLFFYARDVSI
jgi:DMSO/TMAO reductase YedYZ molybdopterin-dependent catalytic subunit